MGDEDGGESARGIIIITHPLHPPSQTHLILPIGSQTKPTPKNIIPKPRHIHISNINLFIFISISKSISISIYIPSNLHIRNPQSITSSSLWGISEILPYNSYIYIYTTIHMHISNIDIDIARSLYQIPPSYLWFLIQKVREKNRPSYFTCLQEGSITCI